MEIATLGKMISTLEELESEGEVKITMNTNREALYFSRAIIPFVVGTSDKEQLLSKFPFFKHVGMYAYRADILESITKLSVSSLEKVERLEQLRWLENGFKVSIVETTEETMCIDTPEDLERARTFVLKS